VSSLLRLRGSGALQRRSLRALAADHHLRPASPREPGRDERSLRREAGEAQLRQGRGVPATWERAPACLGATRLGGGRTCPSAGHFSADLLASALELAARRVSAPCAGRGGPDEGRVRWGRELDVAVITDHEQGRRRAAAYLAKYSTKSTEELGVLDHRLRAGVPESLDLSAHMRSLVETAWSLGVDPSHQKLRLHLWAHTAGYRGHFLTKSRRFSTTFAALRDARREWRVAANGHHAPDTSPGTDDGDEIISEWSFVGMGYTNPGDAWLAESIAEEERLARRFAYEQRQEDLREAS
jgi:hypothetical protein